MDLGIKVLGSIYPSSDDGALNRDGNFVENSDSCRPNDAGSDQGRGLSTVYPAVESDQPHSQRTDGNLTDRECRIPQRHSNDLSFDEFHYADIENGERLFKSLELGHGTCDDFERSSNSWCHHSMDDMSTLERAQPTVLNERAVGRSSSTRQEKAEEDGIETAKNYFLSAWTNTKNGWLIKTKTDFKCDSAIWLLGKVYHFSQEPIGRKQELHKSHEISTDTLEKFKLDFKSRLWFTYRTDIPTLPRSHLKSDVGWGCMLRCGQMLLGQAMLVHFLKRDWMWNPLGEEQLHRRIIRYFGDARNSSCPFSIHNLVEIGMLQLGKKPGDWYGPASISHAMRLALKHAQLRDSLLDQISVYVAHDGVVYIEDLFDEYYVEDESTLNSSSSSQLQPKRHTYQERAIILLVPMRLGGDALNQTYVPCLKTLLNTPSCVGIIGGRPKHSLYFTGWQDEKLIYLDPHCCQDFVDVLQQDFPLNTFHCGSPRKLPFAKMDPSCAIGFYCQTRLELDQLLREIPKIVATPLNRHYPMFQIERGRHSDVELWSDFASTKRCEPSELKSSSKTKNSEDFTLL